MHACCIMRDGKVLTVAARHSQLAETNLAYKIPNKWKSELDNKVWIILGMPVWGHHNPNHAPPRTVLWSNWAITTRIHAVANSWTIMANLLVAYPHFITNLSAANPLRRLCSTGCRAHSPHRHPTQRNLQLFQRTATTEVVLQGTAMHMPIAE